MKYVCSWSGGKDSTADIILSHIHNEPLDLIIFSEVMFSKEISGELPEHINFIKNIAIPRFESWGYEVRILHAEKTYLDWFHKVKEKSKYPERNGMKYGFPMAGRCVINNMCKVKPIKDFYKDCKLRGEEVIQHVGIAIDEPERLHRMNVSETPKISMLEKYGYTEQMAYDLCKEYNLLSPIYSFTKRGGCWFCPNARDCQLRHIRDNYNDLWKELLALEDVGNTVGNIWNTRSKISIKEKEKQFANEDMQMNIFSYID